MEDVDCYQQCPLLFNCCRSGTKVRLNLPLYDGAEAKKSLEKFIRQRAAKENPDGIGADFERIHVIYFMIKIRKLHQVSQNRIKVATDGNIIGDKCSFEVPLKDFLLTS